ncbi:Inner membrane protein YbhL [Carnimonas sp. R-84981]|uniref:Bax inhibitor-1/YccA family protein n=1 Tax=Carnimonas bestiolae TaxID=3402172 RepID=UPI003EDC2327
MPRFDSSQTLSNQHSSAIQSFMTHVYAWMCGGLAITAVVAFWLAQNPQLVASMVGSTGGILVLAVIQLGLVFVLSGMAHKLSAPVATAMFVVYCAVTGITFSSIFLAFTMSSIASVFAISAGMFGAMSLYGMTTKKDLSGWGSFLFMGLIGVVIASLVNIWLKSEALMWVVSFIGVVVFTGLTAYDTQKIKQLAVAGETSSSNVGISRHNAIIVGALTLYLDFINLFIMLLRIFGDRR